MDSGSASGGVSNGVGGSKSSTSFRLSVRPGKKAESKRAVEHFERADDSKHRKTDEPQLIKEVEGSKIRGLAPEQEKGPLVIPLIKKNNWRTGSATPPVETENATERQSSDSSTFTDEPSTVSTADLAPNLMKTYGLITRKSQKKDEGSTSKAPVALEPEAEKKADVEVGEKNDLSLEEQAMQAVLADAEGRHTEKAVQPILVQNQAPGLEKIENDVDKFRHDVTLRPDEASLADYERIPVEQFGAAMLRGMGWNEGEVVGRNKKNGLQAPIIYEPRPRLLGLGATPAPPEKKQKKYIKPGEQREPIPQPVQTKREEEPTRKGNDRTTVSSSSSIREGDMVGVISGKHKGTRGEVVSLKNKSDGVALKIKRGKEEFIRVWSDEVKLFDASKTSSSSPQQRPWLRPHIRIRIISKSFGNGRYYKHKGIIQDVIAGGSAIVKTDEGELVEGVLERHVETCIPAVGKDVLVVRHDEESSLVGITGKVLDKSSTTEKVVVQLDHELEIRCADLMDVSP
ncbi:hypothetical protein HK102_009526 [Quaeritorhiza haematococci]|nr:hypothetical protein HK102_009526 [Quaeritorhiza haematococci]